MNTKLNPQRMIIRTQSIRNRKAPELIRGQESIEKRNKHSATPIPRHKQLTLRDKLVHHVTVLPVVTVHEFSHFFGVEQDGRRLIGRRIVETCGRLYEGLLRLWVVEVPGQDFGPETCQL
ncbi:hypothetical protein DCAR_0728176 [Daucus carota subsp. sativus]|uniref:Uncharacterized protein n=1 Tax=Daucus carota subsp. sativus TaxID=79200 RepID=A0A175YB78_DAUCS|nr:hypothetical protein DCAR_0728176 [Daucus carota subsp. sativus]